MPQTVRFLPERVVPAMGPNASLEILDFKNFNLLLTPGTNLAIADDIIEKLKKSETYLRLQPLGAIEIITKAETSTTDKSVSALDEKQALLLVSGLTDIDQLKAIAIEQAKLKRLPIADAANRRIKEIQDGKTATA